MKHLLTFAILAATAAFFVPSSGAYPDGYHGNCTGEIVGSYRYHEGHWDRCYYYGAYGNKGWFPA